MITIADLAIVENFPAFAKAYEDLTRMVSPEHACDLLEFGVRYLDGIRSGSPPEPKPAEGAVIVLALLHVTMGTPLHLSDELLDKWALGDGTVAECSMCGYRHPAGARSCHVCSGATGPGGCWAERRGRVAVLN